MSLTNLSEIIDRARKRKSRRLVVAAAEDATVLSAIIRARAENLVDPILVGDTAKILELCNVHQLGIEDIPLLEEKDPEKACVLSVELIRSGEADILMKGLVSTTPLLKAVLDRAKGLRKNDFLSHAALFEIPSYHKLLAITDAAMNVNPGITEKISIIENTVEIFHRLNITEPKVAILSPVEKVNPKIQSTLDAEQLKQLNQSGKIRGCLVDGPLAFDIAVSPEAARHKGIKGPVAGDADILVCPDLNSGNILYKSLVFMGNSVSAAIIMGAQVPIVLTSRSDSDQTKLMSIALASALD
jgi:phosphate butyryltransferase